MTKTIMPVSLGGNSAAYLLLDTPLSKKKYKNDLLKHLLKALFKSFHFSIIENHCTSQQDALACLTEIQETENQIIILKEQRKSIGQFGLYISFTKTKHH